MDRSYPQRLIEVDLPIKRISAHARREKSIRHGHISTLHIWWARRPLAACRAVICAALWPDPADPLCPQAFRDKAVECITTFANKATSNRELAASCSQESLARWVTLAKPENRLDPTNPAHLDVLRSALLDFIADFANWDNSTVREYLGTSRALTQAAHEALGGVPGTRPLVVDPFAGGGSIPLEALRVGADAFASDLNPVAVLLNKVVLEYIPKYGQRLADEVRKWGEWIRQEAEKELAEFYPKDPDGATPIAYLWARTIQCEGPGCGVEVPLIRSPILATRNRKSVCLVPRGDVKNKCVLVEISLDGTNKAEPTVRRGSATCPLCGYTTPSTNARRQFKDRAGGTHDAKLLCVITTRKGVVGKTYRLPTGADQKAFQKSLSAWKILKEKCTLENLSVIPDEPLPYLRSIFNINLLGVTQWGQLHTPRQAVALAILSKSIRELWIQLKAIPEQHLAQAIHLCLGLALDRSADRMTSLCR
jgi:putative DNA methylase